MEQRLPRPPEDTGAKIRFADIGAQGQARLLEMTYNRLVFGVSVISIVGAPFVFWSYELGTDYLGLLAWTLAYALATVGVHLQCRVYRRDLVRLDSGEMVRKWLPIAHGLALTHGLGLASSVVLTGRNTPFEFDLLLYISLAAIMAANATHQSPVLSVFRRFFAAGWGGCTVLVPWSFPDHWRFVLPLSLVFILSIYRHALIAHRFHLQQVQMEEDGVRLAESYRAAKEEAEAALKAKNQFLITASHDLRQPVHAMGFLIESIACRNNDESLVPALMDLKQSVRSVTQMFNSLLDLSRIEAGAVPVRAETVSLGRLMDDVATVFREEASTRGLELRVRPARGNAMVCADTTLLRQSMVNLMHNALRYTRRGGVLMAARRRGDDWQLEVWDTGVGVATEDQPHIYSPFFRNEHAWRIDSAGHGLGLAVVARCAGLMGARHGLISREGKGSRFWLRLPAATIADPRPENLAPTGETGTAVAPGLLSGACLVVDDDPAVCAAWESLLGSWGMTVRCVASAAQGFAAIDAGFRPDALFCDQRLRSGESGFDLLRALLERCPEASGAMISGEFDAPELQQAEDEGYLVLRKPLQPEELCAVLSRWLALG